MRPLQRSIVAESFPVVLMQSWIALYLQIQCSLTEFDPTTFVVEYRVQSTSVQAVQILLAHLG